jgi:hypothetical protein
MLDGRWGCAYAPRDRDHTRSISRVLGVAPATPVDEDDDGPLSMSALRRGLLR